MWCAQTLWTVCTCLSDTEGLRKLTMKGGPAILALCMLLLANRIGAAPSMVYDACEFFAGDAAVSKGLSAIGWRVASLDIRYMSDTSRPRAMDLCTPAGFASVP